MRRRGLSYCIWGGQQLQKLFNTLPEAGDYGACVQALNKYFELKKNVPKERQGFLTAAPETGETINSFMVKLKKIVEYCEYGAEEDNQIRDRVLYYIRDKALKRKLYHQEALTLTKLQEIVNVFDEPEALLLAPSVDREEANATYTRNSKGTAPSWQFRGKCWRCDGLGHMGKDCKKSQHHTCEKCSKIGHFPACCHTTGVDRYQRSQGYMEGGRGGRRVRAVEEHDGEDAFYMFSVSPRAQAMPIKIEGTCVSMVVDSGSSCNIIPEAMLRKFPGLKLSSCSSEVYAYAAQSPLEVVGSCVVRMSVQGGGSVDNARLLVIEGDQAALLGRKTAEELGVLRVGLPVNACFTGKLTKERLREMYPMVFSGLGRLKNYQLKLNLDEGVAPVAQPVRRIPFSRRDKVVQKLKELEDLDVIEKGPKWMVLRSG